MLGIPKKGSNLLLCMLLLNQTLLWLVLVETRTPSGAPASKSWACLSH